MKKGFSSNAFVNTSLSESIKAISEIGYDGIEIVLDHPHAFLPLSTSTTNEIKNSLKKNNLDVSNLNANTVLGHDILKNEPFEPSLSNCDNKLRNWRISYTKKAIDLAYDLGSPSICITSGKYHEQTFKQEISFFKNSLFELGEYAEKKNVSICIEYEPGLLIGNSSVLFDLILCDFKNIGLNLDTCHVAVLDENFSNIIKKFNSKIFHTHISDCKNNIHYHLIPGDGEIDFKQFFFDLNQIKYTGYLTAELYTYSDTPIEAASKTFNYLVNSI